MVTTRCAAPAALTCSHMDALARPELQQRREIHKLIGWLAMNGFEPSCGITGPGLDPFPHPSLYVLPFPLALVWSHLPSDFPDGLTRAS
jgi:hypothetical protein